MDIKTYLIVLPGVFLAGLVDSIGGGGGLISIPAYLLAGLPPHLAIGTNKFSAGFGTSLSAVRFYRKGFMDLKLALPAVACALVGSALGSRLSMVVAEGVLEKIMYVILPIAAIAVLNKDAFSDRSEARELSRKKIIIISCVAALVIGCYDGFYGPGTGAFLIIAFTTLAKMDVTHANAQAKAINVTSNLTSMVVFLIAGQVIFPLGILAAAFNMLGNYIGSSLAIKNGAKITRPVIILVLVLLFINVIRGL